MSLGVSSAPDQLERLGAALPLDAPTASRRMLVIVNPYATTVSDRLRHLVVYALRSRYRVHAVSTEAPGHATELCRDAAREGYEVVVAFGGDGTVNEAANGLAAAGGTTALTCLPGGSSNVYCRMLGIPVDVVDATEHLLGLADDWRPRRVDLACVSAQGGSGALPPRHFTFASGLGLDASVVHRVDRHPRLKARHPQYYFTYATLEMIARRYVLGPPALELSVDGRTLRGVTAVVQNAEAFTYFSRHPVAVAPDAALDDGRLAGAVLGRANPIDVPAMIWRGLSSRSTLGDHRHIHPFSGAAELEVRSLDGRPVPLEVDGDYIGEVTRARYAIEPHALTVVA